MTGPEVLDVARDAIVTLVLVASPLMLIGLAVGVAISLVQALTQIQEQTVAFVPKLLATIVVSTANVNPLIPQPAAAGEYDPLMPANCPTAPVR